MIRTVLFDLDGTILNTNELIYSSFEYVWERKGWEPIARETLTPYMGLKLHDIFRELAHADDQKKLDELTELYREYNWRRHDELVQAFPYVQETISVLKNEGIQMGVVTTKIRQTTEQGLKLCGLYDAMDAIVTLNDVTHAKPHPEPVYKAMEQLGADPAFTIMVGDSTADLLAARAAGIRSAAVSWSVKSKEELLKHKPDYWLEDIRDILTIVGTVRSEAE